MEIAKMNLKTYWEAQVLAVTIAVHISHHVLVVVLHLLEQVERVRRFQIRGCVHVMKINFKSNLMGHMSHKILLLLLLSFFRLSVIGQENKMNVVQINFKGKVYNHLVLRSYINENIDYMFEGTTNDGSCWKFIYPDSLYTSIQHATIFEKSAIDTVRHSIAFNFVINSDTLKAGGFLFDRGDVQISAQYYKANIYEGVLTLIDGKPILRTIYQDQYEVTADADKTLLSSIEAIGTNYSVFPYMADYNKCLNDYISLSDKYPNSQSLMWHLSVHLTNYRSREDVKEVYSCFSEQNRNSLFGSRVKKYIETAFFENMELPLLDTEKPELIIKDPTKPNLILFSASYCIPCIKEIPLLKKIYADLSPQIEFVYISIDEKNGIDAWRKLMIKEKIPWKSFIAPDHLKEVQNKYFVLSIPYTLLVYPEGSYEVIDVRKEEHVKKLYALLEER